MKKYQIKMIYEAKTVIEDIKIVPHYTMISKFYYNRRNFSVNLRNFKIYFRNLSSFE
jgi:hypothetical protein